MFKKILLANDGSKHSLRAAEKAIELAKLKKDAKVEVIYVVDGKTSKTDVINHWNEAEVEGLRLNKLEAVAKKAKEEGIEFEIKILRGEPAPTIIKHANENDFDMLVIGSRGLNKLQEMVLGSVSHKVAKYVKCPVLIIK